MKRTDFEIYENCKIPSVQYADKIFQYQKLSRFHGTKAGCRKKIEL